MNTAHIQVKTEKIEETIYCINEIAINAVNTNQLPIINNNDLIKKEINKYISPFFQTNNKD